MRRGLAPVAALALAGGVAAACAPAPPAAPPPPAGPPRNVVVALVDTLRADHLSLHGYERPTSPRLDARARQGVVFDQARSEAGCTFPSVNSLLTSLHPARFLGQEQGFKGYPEGVETLPELLAARGFATWAVSASSVVRATPSKFNRFGGYGGGFETFDESCERGDASCVNRRALELVDAGDGQPFFLYLHYMETHGPYWPPEEHARRFTRPYESKLWYVNEGDGHPIMRSIYGDGEKVDWTRDDLEHLVDLYDEEVAWFDEQFDRLLDALAERGLLDETLVVLVADHGEHLRLEHGEYQHCRSAWEESIRTPLVVWGPGVARGLRVADPVANLDVLPTILDLLGAPLPEGAAGRSLRPWLEGGRGERAPTFHLQSRFRAVVDGRLKLVADLEAGTAELYDVVADPGERNDLAGERPADRDRLLAALEAWIDRKEGGDAAERLRIADEEEARLRSVGYL